MTPTARPFNQRLRILALRVFFVAAVPLILFTRSAWMDNHTLFALLEVTGIFFIIAGVLGRFWAILYIGAIKNQTVMQDGPYSICRHPLYLFSTLGVLGFGLMLGSLILTVFLGMSVFLILTATARREERFLRSEFGPAYDAYAARVPRIMPKLSLYQSPETVTSSLKAIKINFADALVFLAFIPLAKLMQLINEAGLLPSFPLY